MKKNGPFNRIVRFEIYDFGFEMQESSDFEIPDFLIPDFRFQKSPTLNPNIVQSSP